MADIHLADTSTLVANIEKIFHLDQNYLSFDSLNENNDSNS